MARTNNLTNFLTDVAGAIKQKRGDNTAILASDFDTEILNLPSQGTYQEKEVTISTNGNMTLLPDNGYDALSRVILHANVIDAEYATNLALSEQILGVEEPPYTELQYIQSTGTQYIDTGIVCATDMDVSIEVEFPVAPSTETCIAGSGGGSGGTRMFFGYSKDGSFSYGYKNRERTGLLSIVSNIRYRIGTSLTELNQHYVVNDNELYADNVSGSYTNNKNLYIFCCNSNVGANYFASMKLYGVTIWKDDVKVAEYVPALDDENIACLYDTVNEVYLYNAGTGTFTAGPVVS